MRGSEGKESGRDEGSILMGAGKEIKMNAGESE